MEIIIQGLSNPSLQQKFTIITIWAKVIKINQMDFRFEQFMGVILKLKLLVFNLKLKKAKAE